MKLETGLVKVNISISEANGFSKYKNNPKELQFQSLEFKSPEVKIVDKTLQAISTVKTFTNELFEINRFKKSQVVVVGKAIATAKYRAR